MNWLKVWATIPWALLIALALLILDAIITGVGDIPFRIYLVGVAALLSGIAFVLFRMVDMGGWWRASAVLIAAVLTGLIPVIILIFIRRRWADFLTTRPPLKPLPSGS